MLKDSNPTDHVEQLDHVRSLYQISTEDVKGAYTQLQRQALPHRETGWEQMQAVMRRMSMRYTCARTKHGHIVHISLIHAFNHKQLC